MALATWMQPADGQKIEEMSVPVDGHKMHCLTTGRGPALALFHGLLGTADAWRPCLPRLAEESSVYAVDTLCIGKSERVPGLDASLIAQADRMSRFLAKAGIRRADIVGTSHGGSMAMMLAARHPEQVRSLILHAPANPFSFVGDPLVHFYRTPLGRWFARQVPNLPEKLQELALGRMYGNSKLVRREALERYMSSLRMPGTTEHVMNIIDGWFDDMRELGTALEKLHDLPVLLVWGTHDRAVSLESGHKLERMLHHAELVVIPGMGHLPHDEAPLAFADAINGFLRHLDRSEAERGPRLVRSNGQS
ncbi:alpha/beta hydrolase [Alloacidobacterium sp.]|uniref:alpha/beta fold hydrolase n=1 Tax=Alloacidobacterium sp. TaxID=2951999 RepID=UPI002D6A3C64|nr:alpha/beta hydrolase [Alloacidobacterium sp.]HYK36029.1 alpha/beta hydrolase [Alloacidobacterium sp.]